MNADQICELYYFRKTNMGVDIDRMREIKGVMEGEIFLPLPELATDEKPATANLAQQGMNQMARRIASVEPTFYFPSINPGDDTSDARAADRHRIVTGWRADNKMKRRLGKRSRHFLAYACAPVVIKPDKLRRIPRWMVKDPLHTYPGDDVFEDCVPPDCIFENTYTYKALLDQWQGNNKAMGAIAAVSKNHEWSYDNDRANYDCKFTVIEWIDDMEDHLVLLGQTDAGGIPLTHGSPAETLIKADNLAGRPLVIVPGSINLDAQLGHFDGIIGMYQTQAALMALTIVAQRRSVWPREWLNANPGEQPEIVSIPDPYIGQPGEVRGGRLETQKLDPSFHALEVMDRLAEAQRQTASLPPEFGGQSGNNIRTGRRGAQVMGASIDFTIAEAQDIFSDSMMEETKVAIAIDKAYFARRKVYYIASRGYSGSVDYTAKQTWETDVHIVDYPIAGTDLQNLPIEGGQRVAMGTLSQESFMNMDPVVKDVGSEIQKIQREGVKTAFLTSIQTLAAAPDGPYQPIHLARLDEKLATGMELYKAVTELQGEIQKEQAEAAPTPADAQPGLSQPGQGVEQPASIPEGEPSMQNLTGLLGQLGTAQTARAYRPVG